ncbi:MAG: PIG-L family deacetylase [Erysipelotrichaceae bacterium]
MKYKRIISIGAHSLDAELLGGPLLLKYSKLGAKCTYVHVTSGRLEDPKATEIDKQLYINKIKEENIKAAHALLADVYSFNYISSELPTTNEFINIIKDYLIKEKADLVITHARGTLHPRHYYVYETVTIAIKQLRKEGYNINLLYGENCEDLIGFIPTLYISISEEDKDIWFKGLSQYSIFNGKVNDMPYIQYYTAMLKIRAVEADTNSYVKAYMHAPLIDNE